MQDVLDSLEEGFAGKQTDAKQFLKEVTGLISALFPPCLSFRKKGFIFFYFSKEFSS
jgi:hypothetical protein